LRTDVLAELPTYPPEDDGGPLLFERWTMPALLAEPTDFDWLIKGLLADPTYGQIAGELKTLKSYLLGFIEVGQAAGVPIFGRFTPKGPRRVVPHVGEGGRKLWTRRIRRISSAMGVDPKDLDLHPTFDVAPISSLRFQESLRRDLEPDDLVTLDPLYVYHGIAHRASDLHQEGALLNQLSKPCMDAGASLLVVNHFNQTGTGSGLKRITMAGSGEWADSWLLLAHREPPDVNAGQFRLTLEIGSRQWGGTTWDLDLGLGHFDQETGTHDGEITWDLRPACPGVVKESGSKSVDAQLLISEVLADCPWTLTKTELRARVGGSRAIFDEALSALVDKGVITHDLLGRNESGITKRRPLWGLTPTPADANRPGWQDQDF
ncbi:MAG: AAA family ATPase, partial [Acidimicrobiales bacterium]